MIAHGLHLEYPNMVKQPADLNCGLFQVAFEFFKRGNTQLYVLEYLSPSMQLNSFLSMVIHPVSVSVDGILRTDCKANTVLQ